jgi:hypothetical protein
MMTFEIVVYEYWGKEHWAQTKYIARGYDDVLWTNDLDAAITFIKEQIERYA